MEGDGISNSSIYADFKKEIIVKDYEVRCNRRQCMLDRIHTFRQWEITLLAAILTYALAQDPSTLLPSVGFLIFAVLFLFFTLELAATGSLRLAERSLIEVEKNFRVNKNLENLYASYQFNTFETRSATLFEKLEATTIALRRVQFWAWHIPLAILFAILVTLI